MTQKTVNVAIIGATGAVGEALRMLLEERNFPVKQLFLLASAHSAGETLLFHNKPIIVEELANFDFKKVSIALFSAGKQVSLEFVPKAVEAGCLVIDNTSAFRYEDDIPLVVSEVNPQDLELIADRGVIANPNCSTMQMAVALKPIHDAVGISRINVTTFQSVSGAGRRGIEELATQTAELLNGHSIKPKVFSKQISFNVIPHIDRFEENGYTWEEMKMVLETRKILGDNNIMVNPTAVRVPVFYGHSMAVHIETKQKITADKARTLLKKAPGVKVMDQPNTNKYPTAVEQASGHDEMWVGRIREDISHPLGLNLWVVSDNIRKGAALNALQLAEIMIKRRS